MLFAFIGRSAGTGSSMGKEFRSPRRPLENNRCRAAVHSQVVQTPVSDFEFAPVRIAHIERLKPIIAVIDATESHDANIWLEGTKVKFAPADHGAGTALSA